MEVPIERETKQAMTKTPATANRGGRMESPKFTVLSAPPAALTAPEKAPAKRKIKHITITFSSPADLAAALNF